MTRILLIGTSLFVLAMAGTINFAHTTRESFTSLQIVEVQPVTPKLSTYLLFDGNCNEAMDFYKSVFGGELMKTTVGLSPMKGMFPESLHSRILHANLHGTQVDISASDWLHPTEQPIRGNTVCLYLSGGSRDNLKKLFEKLSKDAEVTDPLQAAPFGLYGALNDRFGVRWMFQTAEE